MTEPVSASDPTPLDHALSYARRGWRVIPIPRGYRYPKGFPKWQNEATTDEATIRRWWNTDPTYGVGIATGPESGIWVLDVDIKDGKPGAENLADLEGDYHPLPDTYEVITGSGGRHLYFTWPTDGQDISNSASAKALGDGLDVRGAGGFVVAPPTWHPDFDRLYEQELGATTEVAEAPGWLLAKLQKPEPVARPPRSLDEVGDRPGDLWAASTSWGDILTPDGWTLHHVDRSGEEHWTRPGKETRDGTSATTGYLGSDVLKVFTSSLTAAGLEAEQTYTKLGYLAATRHGGDHSAAARALRAEGFHAHDIAPEQIQLAPRTDPGGRTGIVLEEPGTSGTRSDTTPGAPAEEPWPDPIPLGADHVLPAFPTHVYPAWIEDYITEVAEDLQVPVDLPATLALGALSTLAAGHVVTKVHGRWKEHANLYLVVAVPPSVGKSPAYKRMCSPVIELEKEHQKQMRAEVAANADMVEVIEADLKRTKQLADVNPKSLAEIRERLYEAQEKPTTPRKFTIGDVTPEKLGKLIADNGGRIALHSTEGGVFGQMTGRYSDNLNLDVYLQAWSGDRIDTARIGREDTTAEEALLTVLITVQPQVIADLAKTPELAGRGLTARFMYSTPLCHVGWRDMSLRDTPSTPHHDAYGDQLRTLGRQWLSWGRPAAMTIDGAGTALLSAWREQVEARRRPGADLEAMAEWSGKMESSVIRAATLLHLAWGHSHGEPIGQDTVAQGIILGEYWVAHAGHVHDLWGSSPDIADARAVLDWAEAQAVTEFSVRDLYAGNRGRFKKADDTLGPLTLLTERGWLRTVDGGAVATTRGRQSVRFVLNPGLSTSSARRARSARGGPCSSGPPNGVASMPSRVHDVHSVLKAYFQALTYSVSPSEDEDPPAQSAHVAQNSGTDRVGPGDAQNAQNFQTCGQLEDDDLAVLARLGDDDPLADLLPATHTRSPIAYPTTERDGPVTSPELPT